MRHLPIMDRVKSVLGPALATWLAFGLVETANAASCAVEQVTINGMNATSCGWGTTTVDTTDGDTWQVNSNFAGGRTDWALYEREVGVAGDDNSHEGNTSTINLKSSRISDDPITGVMALNVFNPTLITLADGGATLYHWYYFEGITGTPLDGSWDVTDLFGGNGSGDGGGSGGGTHVLSQISAYTVVPVPAAVWLFGSGLLGLFGIAGRGKTA